MHLELCFKKVSMRLPAETNTALCRILPSFGASSHDYPKAMLQPETPQTHSAAFSKTSAPENRPPATHAALTPARIPSGTHRQCHPKRPHRLALAALSQLQQANEASSPQSSRHGRALPHAVPAAAQSCEDGNRSHLSAPFATASQEAKLLKRQLPACPSSA